MTITTILMGRRAAERHLTPALRSLDWRPHDAIRNFWPSAGSARSRNPFSRAERPATLVCRRPPDAGGPAEISTHLHRAETADRTPRLDAATARAQPERGTGRQ